MRRRIALAKRYASVSVICWDRCVDMLGGVKDSDVDLREIQIPYGGDSIMKRRRSFRDFKKRAMQRLIELRPNIVHAQSLEMMLAAREYKIRYNPGTRIIYEIADLHRYLVDKPKSLSRACLQRFLTYIEQKCCNVADLIVLTSDRYYDQYFKRFVEREKTMFFPNVPDLRAFDAYVKKEGGQNKPFTVGFIGTSRYKEELKVLLQAAGKVGVNVLLAGNEQGAPEIENLCKKLPYVEWRGLFDFNESAAELYSRCDSIYCVYDVASYNVRYALPNKLYESVYCELPIIVAKSTRLAEIVDDWGVGIAVAHDSQPEHEDALIRLRDDREYYDSIVASCRAHKSEIDLEKYNKVLGAHIERLLNESISADS